MRFDKNKYIFPSVTFASHFLLQFVALGTRCAFGSFRLVGLNMLDTLSLSRTTRSMYVKNPVQFSHFFHLFFTHFSHEFHTHISHACEILHSEVYVKRV